MNELAKAASAREQHGRDRRAAAARRDGVERRSGRQGADEGRGRQQRRAKTGEPLWQAVAEHDRQRRAEARASRNPGKSRVGERIAEEALHERA
jgi:hypothetical protein